MTKSYYTYFFSFFEKKSQGEAFLLMRVVITKSKFLFAFIQAVLTPGYPLAKVILVLWLILTIFQSFVLEHTVSFVTWREYL